MAAPVRTQKRTVRDLLLDDDSLQDFFQAVRFTERLYPEKNPVGEGTDPGLEAVRFKSNILMTFPPGQIDDVKEDKSLTSACSRIASTAHLAEFLICFFLGGPCFSSKGEILIIR